MQEEIWHLSSDFTKLRPRDVLKNILRDDKKNYDVAESELREEIELLDNAITLYIELLQAAYRHIDEWKNKAYLQAAIAMAVSTINYILLARHSILLGYYPEARDLLRGCYERTTRCYLFFADEKEAQRFLSGAKIWQKDVDSKLARIFAEEGYDVFEELRNYYGYTSKQVHPNLDSLQARTLDPEFKTRVGLVPIFGGFLSSTSGQIVIVILLKSVISALHVLSAIVSEQTGKWNEDYEKVKASTDKLLNALKDSTP